MEVEDPDGRQFMSIAEIAAPATLRQPFVHQPAHSRLPVRIGLVKHVSSWISL
jgi:hypothetical protein